MNIHNISYAGILFPFTLTQTNKESDEALNNTTTSTGLDYCFNSTESDVSPLPTSNVECKEADNSCSHHTERKQ